ncbi:uncharacterized protein Z520_11158 [Fonsecaea multimorphosa CBS 102226]|uniref:Manganese lipoxygenase n=1 Tax=Fonsecaea multimorphosa CBS 102226 TaxID=1442371 RepID=A0A0D2I796_9EURO|nr:uncharacterized protein Z520_11158 [Fonsecaea multimorphosa CBS 102226]KIX93101.1 hypothetical protein Z520_11158 [Fonsecaea multimorphosa CBS 102226]
MPVEVQQPPNVTGGTPTLDDILNGMPRQDVEDDPMVGLVLSTNNDGAVNCELAVTVGFKKGTFKGTQMALTEIYSLLEDAAVSHFDSKGLEPILCRSETYKLERPIKGWTLALNAAARMTLVPFVIAIDPNPQTNRTFSLVDWSYNKFNFQEHYVPNDLKKRGFDVESEDGLKYRNYPYATDMALLWGGFDTKIRAADSSISDWCNEVQTRGQINNFPTITTVDQLIDAVTMCIHIASPQHTAVNYLQDFYYSFVPSKPPALCTPLPQDLKTLKTYTEKELTAALPISTDGPKWKDWLLAAQLPELLSFKVESRDNLITYAKSLYNVNKGRTVLENKKFDAVAIAKAAADFYSDLKNCGLAFEYVPANQTEGTVEYKVLQPDLTAVSTLI